jgi:hypothetical protein
MLIAPLLFSITRADKEKKRRSRKEVFFWQLIVG